MKSPSRNKKLNPAFLPLQAMSERNHVRNSSWKLIPQRMVREMDMLLALENGLYLEDRRKLI